MGPFERQWLLQADMWERQGRAVKPSELGTPAKEVKKRGSKDEPADSSLAADGEAEVLRIIVKEKQYCCRRWREGYVLYSLHASMHDQCMQCMASPGVALQHSNSLLFST